MKHFLLDGYNLAFRSYYAMPNLTRDDGLPTGALQAFCSSLLRLSSIDTPHTTTVFFDSKGSKRHLDIYPQYKANRGDAPDDFKTQVPFIKQLCSLFNYNPTYIDGIEADDLLASLAIKIKSIGHTAVIVSADKDFAQLICPTIHQLLPPKPKTKDWIVLDTVGVKTKFGVTANQIPDYLALMGDSADNIAGINGVGPKTAAKWLKDFGDIPTLINRADWVKPERFRQVIKDNAQLLQRNLQLVTLKTDYEVQLPEKTTPDFDEIIKFLEDMQMKKAISNVKQFAKEQYQIVL